MWGNKLIWVTIAGTLLACTHPARGQFQSGVYRIISGDYIETGGLIGTMRVPLPVESQAYAQLTLDQHGGATLTFLRDDMQTPLRFFPCPRGRITDYTLSGLVFSDRIRFQPPQGDCLITGSYMAGNAPGRLRIDGTVVSDTGFVPDFPYRFTHTNVVAVLMPEAAIRVSEFAICWLGAANTAYQVQYRDELTANAWTNLGAPRTGDGTMNCVTDKVPAGRPRRFYRILPVP